jgi:hypothetical protein
MLCCPRVTIKTTVIQTFGSSLRMIKIHGPQFEFEFTLPKIYPMNGRNMIRSIAFISLSSVSLTVFASDTIPAFEAHVIDENIGKVCYAVTVSDVDNDGDTDIVALTENRVIWYEQPSWSAHVILQDQTPHDNVCIAPHDIDGDGLVDFAIGAGWTKSGTLHWIHREADPNAMWTVGAIGEESSVHRIRWADVLGTGTPQLIVSPLIASTGNGVRLLAYEIPQEPATSRWRSTVLDSELNRMHNHWHIDFDDDNSIDTITASREGLSLIRRTESGWQREHLADGATGADDPNQNGAGEVKTGRLADGGRFLTTVEPMHGTQLAVYLQAKQGEPWKRQVIDSGFVRGHALWTADFDGDGTDEIAFGHSDTPQKFGVNVYHATNPAGTTWEKQILDEGGMATEDLVVADLTGDGRPDIVAGGRATHNIKLYVNQPPTAGR